MFFEILLWFERFWSPFTQPQHFKEQIITGKLKNIVHIIIFFVSWRYNPLAVFSLLAYEVSWSHTTTRHSQ